MKFSDTATDTSSRFSIGLETETGRYYLSIPVSNRLVDYEEYYEVSREMHDRYPNNEDELKRFADECRARHNDHLLLMQPGSDRGVG